MCVNVSEGCLPCLRSERSQVRPLPRVPFQCPLIPREVIAAVDGGLALNEAALKQTAVLFNRIALPGLTGLRNAPAPPHQPSITSHLAWLADAGIVFEPDIKPTEDQGIKNQMLKDLDDLYKPSA